MKQSAFSDFSEYANDVLDYARCERPDGSGYGTSGQCRKGVPAEKPSMSKDEVDRIAAANVMAGEVKETMAAEKNNREDRMKDIRNVKPETDDASAGMAFAHARYLASLDEQQQVRDMFGDDSPYTSQMVDRSNQLLFESHQAQAAYAGAEKSAAFDAALRTAQDNGNREMFGKLWNARDGQIQGHYDRWDDGRNDNERLVEAGGFDF